LADADRRDRPAAQGSLREEAPPSRARAWYLLLLIPFVALLWVPIYAKQDPELFGIPFFYWYQFLWVPLTALLTLIVYRQTR
jgi:uncharacterized protein DUF3311